MIQQLPQVISPLFTESVLIEILTKETNLNDIKVTEIIFGDDQMKGDSYLSTVTRFVVKGHGKGNSLGNEVQFSIPIITKTVIKNIARSKTFRSIDFFRNEINFFNKVWPALLAFQKSKNISQPFENIPRCFAALSDGENDFIALEDLSYKNYEGPTRQEGLDLAHTKLILQVFAQFHALSMAFKDQFPKEFQELISNIQETYFSEEYRSWYTKFQCSLFEVVRDAIKKHLPNRYLNKFDASISSDFYGELIALCKINGPLSVITHGDAWVPNFLIKYKDSEKKFPTAAMMIDFQLARYTSLSLDITFFLYSCTDKILRDNHWDELIHYYHQEFAEMLQKLGSKEDLLTLEALKADIKENAKFGVGMTIEALPMSLLEGDELSDLDGIQGDKAVPIDTVWIVRPFESQHKTRRIADFIQDVVDREYI